MDPPPFGNSTLFNCGIMLAISSIFFIFALGYGICQKRCYKEASKKWSEINRQNKAAKKAAANQN